MPLFSKLADKLRGGPKYDAVGPGDITKTCPIELTSGQPILTRPLGDAKDVNSTRLDFGQAFEYSRGDHYDSIFTYGNDNKSQNKYARQIHEEDDYSENRKSSKALYCLLTVLMCSIVFLLFPFFIWICIKFLKRDERLMVFRLGKLTKPKGPGLVLVLPLIDRYQLFTIGEKSMDIAPTCGATKDGGVVETGGSFLYHIDSPDKVVVTLRDLDSSLRSLVQATLLDLMKQFDTRDMQSALPQMSINLVHEVNKESLKWGVKLSRSTLMPPILVREPPEPISMLAKIDISALGRQLAMLAPMLTSNQGAVNMANGFLGQLAGALPHAGEATPYSPGREEVPGTAAMAIFLEHLEMIKQHALANRNTVQRDAFQQLLLSQQKHLIQTVVNNKSATPAALVATDVTAKSFLISDDVIRLSAAPSTPECSTSVAMSSSQTETKASMPGTSASTSSSAQAPAIAKKTNLMDPWVLIQGLLAQGKLAMANDEIRAKIDASYQFNVTGLQMGCEPTDGLFYLDSKSGIVGEGTLIDPMVKIKVHARDLIHLLSATMTLQTALSAGRLQIQGPMEVAVRLVYVLQCTQPPDLTPPVVD